MSVREEVRELSKQVALNETHTVTCPYCTQAWEQQGRPIHWRPSRSFSISRDNTGVLYHCFRASCSSSSGFFPDVTLEFIPKRKFQPHEYSFDLHPMQEEELQYFLERGFNETELAKAGVRFNRERKTCVFNIYDYQGHTVGYVDRDYNNGREVKAINYWFEDVPQVHFARRTEGPILLVEDIPSSIKASRFIDSVSLLGTVLNLPKVTQLRQLTDTIYLALDEDATAKANKLADKYGFYFRNFQVIPLSKDIKDMNEQELTEFSERLI